MAHLTEQSALAGRTQPADHFAVLDPAQ